ncbi:hypothetical protein BKP45_06965 [Anaerobacillus alkalidiazotrophicus]|uniref:6-hydroxymethylpterin diphosphokinase MptE-like domain-containing protein n=1 Tax=Anaerobacillus alkalidiazotrophicus TaxID=472963 RepID=A0A1S2MCK0_9BACI|nr:hypothetical protein BKP45_06965 [Anaerobacillus alkalidiazotrophicus]
MNIIKSKRSLYSTIEINGLFLHSSYNPIKEAKAFAEKVYKKNHLHILYGLGMSYYAKELYSLMEEEDSLIVIEPSEVIFNSVKENINLSFLQENNNISLFVGSNIDELRKSIEKVIGKFSGRITVVESPNYSKLFPKQLHSLYELLKELIFLQVVNLNTINFFSKYWQENFFSNLFAARNATYLSDLIGRISCPIIIASGGPSLTKQLPILKEFQSKVLILCAGSTINSLLKGGIEPDIIVSVDGAPINFSHYNDVDIHKYPLMYPFKVHKDIPRYHKGPQIVFNDDRLVASFINSIFNKDIGFVKAGASVANYCLDIAIQLSFGPICFIGQDLAYTDGITHASGNRRIKKVDMSNEEKYVKVKGYYGNEVYTDYPFLSMKYQFEKYLELFKEERNVFNATEGGIYIKGTDNITFNDFCQKYCDSDYSVEIKNLFNKKSSINLIEFKQKIKQEIKNIKKITEICKGAIKKINNYKEIDSHLIDDLNKYDKELYKLLESELMYYLFQPIVIRIYNNLLSPHTETEQEREKRIMLLSKGLYKDILEASKKSQKWLEELFREIEAEVG